MKLKALCAASVLHLYAQTKPPWHPDSIAGKVRELSYPPYLLDTDLKYFLSSTEWTAGNIHYSFATSFENEADSPLAGNI